MKHNNLTIIFFILLFSLTSISSYAQEYNDSLIHQKGNSFFIGDKTYSKSEILEILNGNVNTKKILHSGSVKKTWGYISLIAGLGVTGGVLYQTWESYNNYGASNKSNSLYLQAGLAIALDITGIFLITDGNKSFINSIKSYNKIQEKKNNSVSLNIGINRVSLTLKF